MACGSMIYRSRTRIHSNYLSQKLAAIGHTEEVGLQFLPEGVE